jgi:protein KRI1
MWALVQMEDEDADELFGGEEEGLAGLSDIEGSSDGEEEPGEGDNPQSFRALRKKLKEQQQQQLANGVEGDEEEGEEGKAKRQEALTAGRSDLQRLLEEYYKLDYEDNIGGIPCRFKYREVSLERSFITKSTFPWAKPKVNFMS